MALGQGRGVVDFLTSITLRLRLTIIIHDYIVVMADHLTRLEGPHPHTADVVHLCNATILHCGLRFSLHCSSIEA